MPIVVRKPQPSKDDLIKEGNRWTIDDDGGLHIYLGDLPQNAERLASYPRGQWIRVAKRGVIDERDNA